MQADRTELNNLAAQIPEKVKSMNTLYQAWVDRSFVEKAGKSKQRKKP